MSELTPPAIGDIIAGRYKLVEELGRGGFGIIFRALQRKGQTPPEIALKVLFTTDPKFNSEELHQRFEREALMAKRLQHRHTVRQYEFGTTPSGVHFIAMELLRGRTLSEFLETQGPLPLPLILKTGHAVLRVLHFSHRQGIVHRDLKPENIMLCTVGYERNVPKVLDFGAAKTTEGRHDITTAGMTLGSPTYMAPEVLMGSPPEPASDLYSLGLTIAELILGHALVRGENAMERARAQLSPDPLPIPKELQRHPLYPWIAKSIDKDLNRRFSSATKMLDALDRFSAKQQRKQAAATIPRGDTNATDRLSAIEGPTTPFPRTDLQVDPPAVADPTEAIKLPPEIARLRARIEADSSQASSDATTEMTIPADDDFANDPTAFIQNPFDPASRTEELPSAETTPTPPESTPSDPTPPPTPEASPDSERTSHPFGQQRKSVAGEYGEKKQHKIKEPSFETNYQTIKTSDGTKERKIFFTVIGATVVFLLMLLLIFGL